MASTQWTRLVPKSPRYLFIPRDETLSKEYEAWWGLKDAFLVGGVGITTAHDAFVINYDRECLVRQFEDFRSFERSSDGLHSRFNVRRKMGWDILDGWDNLQDAGELTRFVKAICYRPFDKRFIFYEDKLVWRTVRRVMRHMLAGPNVGLATTRATEITGGWEHVFVSNSLIQHHTVSLKEVNYLFPLYTYPAKEQEHLGLVREPNLGKAFIDAVGSSVALYFESDGSGDLKKSFGPDDVFHYIYAMLHSPEYRRRYADFLKSDFPRVPLPGYRALFVDLIRPGAGLVSLHLMEGEGTSNGASLSCSGSNRVDKVRYAPSRDGLPGCVWINREQYFEGVEPEIWGFTIGGYRPAEKWLKDRKGQVLTDDDIDHYRKIVAALADTQRLMVEIDGLIDQHGGWPDAFQ